MPQTTRGNNPNRRMQQQVPTDNTVTNLAYTPRAVEVTPYATAGGSAAEYSAATAEPTLYSAPTGNATPYGAAQGESTTDDTMDYGVVSEEGTIVRPRQEQQPAPPA
eukprot:gene487-29713_t